MRMYFRAPKGRLGIRGSVATLGIPLFVLLTMSWPAIFAQKAEAQAGAQRTSGEGNKLFESTCGVCHGLDGAGGEHAPNIARGSNARSFSDVKLTKTIHDGIASKGMPSFNYLEQVKLQAIVLYLRRLQGKSNSQAASGNPANGKEVFFGKGGCTACHAVYGQGRFVSRDLTDYAYDHDSDEIREAIVNPAGIVSMSSVTLDTKAGQKISGVVRNESNSSIQIQDAQGKYFLLEKTDVGTIERSSVPEMPKDYSQKLTAVEISDLVSYIVHQVSMPKLTGASVEKRKKAKFD